MPASSFSGHFDFVITLQSPGYKNIDRVSQWLIFLFLLVYGFYLVRIGLTGHHWWLLVIPVSIVVLWLYGWVRRADPAFLVHYRVELMIAAVAWFMLPLYQYHRLTGIAYALMAVMERWVKIPDEIGFAKDRVVRNSFPAKTYSWNQIDQVVLRDNLFTLDLKNNQVIQKPLQEAVSPETEAEFNAFCRQQLLPNVP